MAPSVAKLWIAIVGLTILWAGLSVPMVVAGDSGEDAAEATQPVTRPRAAGAYPPDPRPFMRGNPGGDRQAPVAGEYFSRWALILVLAMFLLWIYSAQWVDSDSRSLKLRTEFWNTIVLVCGVAGFLGAVFLPQFALGLLALLGLYGIPVGLYIRERNGRVPQSAKLLTPTHIQSVVIRTLARVGINLGSREAHETALGPPIAFHGKSDNPRSKVDVRSRQVESSRGYLAAKELVYDAVLRRSTDIHLEPKNEEMAVRLRIDGVMYPTEPFDRSVGEAVINIFKVLSAMDITEKRRPQDGSFRAELDDREIDFRVASQGTRHGEKMSLRVLDQAASVNALSGLGLRKQLQEKLRSVIHQPHGLFLSAGPTGAGKSTTLYAALRDIDPYQRNIITVEDPVEYKMENVNQIEVNTKTGQTFAMSLRSILRQDPDVLMVGEIRDKETAEIACQAANTGHMVFSTVHANDAVAALFRLLELGVEPFMVANSISAVMSQRLARRLCRDCREAYRPRREYLEKIGLPADRIDRFYRPPKEPEEICSACGGIGYLGRIGIFELLVIDDRLRDLIRDKAPMSKIKSAARKNGMLYMKEEGLRLLARGITSIEELQRVVQ